MPEHLLLEPPVITARPAAVHALACSPWAPLLAATGQRQVLLYHTDSLELAGILPFPEGDPVSLAFTPDGRYLIVGGGVPGKSGVTITFDITNGSRLLTAAKEFDSILAADIRPGFDIVATGGPSRLLKIWNTGTGELVKSIKKHTDWITALDLSSDGVLLASGDRNGGVFVWESESGNEFHSLRAHQAAISATAFRADSNILATASEDGTLRFWEMNGGSEVKKIDAHPGGVTAFAFARDGSSVSAGRDMKVKFWKPDFSHARDLVQNLPALPTAIALDFEGKQAFVGDALGNIQSFQTSDSKKLTEIKNNPSLIETRIQTIASTINNQEQKLTESEKDLAEKTAARDAARNTLSESENELKRLIEAHKTAQITASQTTSEEAGKLVNEASSKIQPAEQTIVQNRGNVEASEKLLTSSTTAYENIKTSINSLKLNQKRWSAATINTKALITRREAEETSLVADEDQNNYTQAAAAIAIQSDALNIKRSDRLELSEHLMRSTSPAITEELQATLAALDIRISIEQARLETLENDSLILRDKAEHTAPLTYRKNLESIALRNAYLKALE
ncbi:WD40 repeat domain-containing protein [Luteolibacter yonseiensis]|nr:WD40 repeat domain-containing protein [Luteolibacter yonseiensis]